MASEAKEGTKRMWHVEGTSLRMHESGFYTTVAMFGSQEMADDFGEWLQRAANIETRTAVKLGEFAKLVDVIDAECKRLGIQWHGSVSTTLKAIIDNARLAPEPPADEGERDSEGCRTLAKLALWNNNTGKLFRDLDGELGIMDDRYSIILNAEGEKCLKAVLSAPEHARIRELEQEVERLNAAPSSAFNLLGSCTPSKPLTPEQSP